MVMFYSHSQGDHYGGVKGVISEEDVAADAAAAVRRSGQRLLKRTRPMRRSSRAALTGSGAGIDRDGVTAVGTRPR
jgi:hypothetical protein